MDIVEKISKNFIEDNFLYGGWNNESLIEKIRGKLYDFDSKIAKIKFLSLFVCDANELYLKHYNVCNEKDECETNFQYESLIYYLKQELERLDIIVNEDTFTLSEKLDVESKLDEILKNFDELKKGQEIIYEDLLKEIEELKSMLFLGKRKWHQLLLGKFTEMTLSGIISETVSKQIIENVNNMNHLIT